MPNTKEAKAARVLELLEKTPDGFVIDADTILADLVENADFELSGTAREAIEIWQKSRDRAGIEQLFELFTDTSFETWLSMAIEKTTRPGEPA